VLAIPERDSGKELMIAAPLPVPSLKTRMPSLTSLGRANIQNTKLAATRTPLPNYKRTLAQNAPRPVLEKKMRLSISSRIGIARIKFIRRAIALRTPVQLPMKKPMLRKTVP
jgi:hypothetical protein